jgi:hypothetical protein
VEYAALAVVDLVPIEYAVEALARLVYEAEKHESEKKTNIVIDGVRYYELIEYVKSFIESGIIAGHIKIYYAKEVSNKSSYLFKNKMNSYD